MSVTKKQEELLLPTKDQMLDTSGRPLTQSLFLEFSYSPFAIYTLKDQDHEYNGKIYPSIKKLYMEEDDPTEYRFANKYFLNMRHWLRICNNKLMTDHIEEWRYELELKLRSEGISQMVKAARRGSQGAARFLTDRGWEVRKAGRPSKEELEREAKIQNNIKDEYADDLRRLVAIK